MGGAARVARAIWDLLRARGFARTLGATMVTLGGALVIGSTFFGWTTLLGVFSLYGVAFWEGSVAAALGFLVIPLGAGMLFVDRRTLRRCCALGSLLIGSLLVILSIATLLMLDQSSARVLLDCFEERRLGCPAGIPGDGRPLTESERAEIRNDIAGEPVSGPGLDGLGIVSAVILVGGTIGVASDRLTSRYPDPANDSDVEPTAALRRALSELSVTTGTAGIGAATLVAVGGGVVAATFVRPWVLLEDGWLAFRMLGVLFREGGIAFCLGLGVGPGRTWNGPSIQSLAAPLHGIGIDVDRRCSHDRSRFVVAGRRRTRPRGLSFLHRRGLCEMSNRLSPGRRGPRVLLAERLARECSHRRRRRLRVGPGGRRVRRHPRAGLIKGIGRRP